MKKSASKIASPAYFLPEVETTILEAIYKGSSLSDVLAPLLKRIVEAGLSGELAAHIESEAEQGVANRRNGRQTKQVRSQYGDIEIETSRDRNGSFEPKLIGKQERQLQNGVEKHILNLYGLGMSYDAIRSHMRKLYAVDLSDAQLTKITDSVQEALELWRNRPLESLYTMVWLDGIHYKIRVQGRVQSVVVYLMIGVDLNGKRDVLGFYMSESESSRYWLQVLENLKTRGVQDILITSTDNLTGFDKAIEAVFPECQQQLCIVHQIRNSVKYLNYKDYKPFTADLKHVYQAPDEQAALAALDDLEVKWGKKYPPAVDNWRRDWPRLSLMFQFGPEIRRLIYTTNPIEGLNRQLRKVTKSKGAFTSEDALKKIIFLTLQNITEKWSKSIKSWNTIRLELFIHFQNRIERNQIG